MLRMRDLRNGVKSCDWSFYKAGVRVWWHGWLAAFLQGGGRKADEDEIDSEPDLPARAVNL